MAHNAKLESISYNPFTVNDNFFNSESDPDINFYSDISPFDTKYFNPNEIREAFQCLCKNGFCLARKQEYSNFWGGHLKTSVLNSTFTVICFSGTWATHNSICNDSNFMIENYTVLRQVRKSSRGGGLSAFVHKEIYFKSRTDLSINSNDLESLCIEIHHKKYFIQCNV